MVNLSLQYQKTILTKFLVENTGQTNLPIYERPEDMTLYSRKFPAGILAPLGQKQSEGLRKALATQEKYSPEVVNFLKHLLYLRNNKKIPWNNKLHIENNIPNTYNLITGEKLFKNPKQAKNKSR